MTVVGLALLLLASSCDGEATPTLSVVLEEISQPQAYCESDYKLPWPSTLGEVELRQGIRGDFTHGKTTWEEYAFDFLVPEGKPVLAARKGTVAIVQNKFENDHYGDDVTYKNQGNYVVVDHGDGTSALYLHLQKDISVIEDQSVLQGQEIGKSGKTGYTSGAPHLHFQLQDNNSFYDPKEPGGEPIKCTWYCKSMEVAFADVPGCKPEERELYVSQNQAVAVQGVVVSREPEPDTAEPPFPKSRPQGQIVYLSLDIWDPKRTEPATLELITADGSQRRTLLSNFEVVFSTALYEFSWLPDGEGIVIAAELETILDAEGIGCEDGLAHSSLYLIGVESGQLEDLRPDSNQFGFEGEPCLRSPVWSPDGEKLAYLCWGGEVVGSTKICVLDLNTYKVSKFGKRYSWSPSWTPDSTQVFFISVSSGTSGESIYRAGANGDSLVQLTDSDPGAEIVSVAVSPDGTKLAGIGGGGRPYTMNLDGSQISQLVDLEDPVGSLKWSPDGNRILFASGSLDSDSHLWIVNSDGTKLERLTPEGDYLNADPVWSPDGKWVAFSRFPLINSSGEEFSHSDVWVISAEGKDLANLTNTPDLDELFPLWRP